MKKVYLVATTGYDGLNIITLHTKYKEALATWNAVRIGMIWDYEKRIESAPRRYAHLSSNAFAKRILDKYREDIKQLLYEHPNVKYCRTSDTPIIMELSLEE